MSDNDKWPIVLLKKLPSHLIFIVIANTQIFKYLIDMYSLQVNSDDSLKAYTLIAGVCAIVVNLIIFGFFAYLKFKQESIDMLQVSLGKSV